MRLRWTLLFACLVPAALLGACVNECVEQGCSPPPAVTVQVGDAEGLPVPGAFVDDTHDGQTVRVQCETAPGLCFLGGGPGPRSLTIGAPGYLSQVRDFDVRAHDDACCGVQPVPVLLDIPLAPAPQP